MQCYLLTRGAPAHISMSLRGRRERKPCGKRVLRLERAVEFEPAILYRWQASR